jgi:hypothetical protein
MSEYPYIKFDTKAQPKRPEGLRAPIFGAEGHEIPTPGAEAIAEDYTSVHRKTTDPQQKSPVIDFLKQEIAPRNWEASDARKFGKPLMSKGEFAAYQPWDTAKWPDTPNERFAKSVVSGIEIAGEITNPPVTGPLIQDFMEAEYDKSLHTTTDKKPVDSCKVFMNNAEFQKMKKYMQTEIDTIAAAYIANIYSKLERMSDKKMKDANYAVELKQDENKKKLESKILEIKQRKLKKATQASARLKQEMDKQYNNLKNSIESNIKEMLNSTSKVIQKFKIEDANNPISGEMSQGLYTPSRLLKEITQVSTGLDGTVKTIRANFKQAINDINTEYDADHKGLDADLKNLDNNEDDGAAKSKEIYDKEKGEALVLTKTFLRERIAKHGFVFPSDEANRVNIFYRKTSASGEGGELSVQMRNIKGYLVAISWASGTPGITDKTTIVLDDPKYESSRGQNVTITITDTCFAEAPPETANVSIEDTSGPAEEAPAEEEAPAQEGGYRYIRSSNNIGFSNNRYFDSVSSDHF